jgi:hypothetical protein
MPRKERLHACDQVCGPACRHAGFVGGKPNVHVVDIVVGIWVLQQMAVLAQGRRPRGQRHPLREQIPSRYPRLERIVPPVVLATHAYAEVQGVAKRKIVLEIGGEKSICGLTRLCGGYVPLLVVVSSPMILGLLLQFIT